MGYNELVKILIERNADINKQSNNGGTPLIGGNQLNKLRLTKIKFYIKIASYYGYLDIVKLLINKGAFVNIQENRGYTALILGKP